MITEQPLINQIKVFVEGVGTGATTYGTGTYGNGPYGGTPASGGLDLTPRILRMGIRRGGSRDGLGTKTDVGLLTFELLDAQDPMAGGVLKPGQTIKVMAGERITVPTDTNVQESFASNVGGWTATGGSTVSRSSAAGRGGTAGMLSIASTSSTSAQLQALRNLTGLTVGRKYVYTAWIRANGNTPMTAFLDSSASGQGASRALSPSTWTEFTHTFTATATTARIYIGRGPVASSTSIFVDDVTVISEGVADSGITPIFTGRVSRINSSYPMDKSTGVARSVTQVTVADAVQIHGSTMRYGVDIDSGFETFESRITRLAATANAPVEVPTQGAPREVYSF